MKPDWLLANIDNILHYIMNLFPEFVVIFHKYGMEIIR